MFNIKFFYLFSFKFLIIQCYVKSDTIKSNLEINQISQNNLKTLNQIKQNSCNYDQKISFIRFSNSKLSLNVLNKFPGYNLDSLLNITTTNIKLNEKLRNNINYSQPITQLCYEACKNDNDCLAFLTNMKQFTCHLIKEDLKTKNKDYLFSDTTNTFNYYEKICQDKVTQNNCNKIWSFDVHIKGHLNKQNNKQKHISTKSLEECLNLCWTNNNGTLNFKCRSINFHLKKLQCTLNQHNRRISPEAYIPENQIDHTDSFFYAENNCLSFNGKCFYRNIAAYYLPEYQIFNAESNVLSLDQCEQYCVNQTQYTCRAFSYSKQHKLCFLSPEPSLLLNTYNTISTRKNNGRRLEVINSDRILQNQVTNLFQNNFIQHQSEYYERTNCINVKIDCNADGMHTKIDIDGPFAGRLFTANNFEKCSKSNFDTSLEQIDLKIPIDSNECGTIASGNGTYSNKLILQYHPFILKESDRRIEVNCDYHLIKQKVRGSKRRILEGNGLSASQVITGLAESPPVKLKILNEHNEEVRGAKLGETLYFKVNLSDESVFGIFGSSLIAKSGNGNETLLLIDDHGCPIEPTIFPSINVKSSDSKSLSVPFQAFKFASDSSIKFQMTISFCLDSCAFVICEEADLMKRRSLDFTLSRKRRTLNNSKEYKTGDIVRDMKMETDFFIISDNDNEFDSNLSQTLNLDSKNTISSLNNSSLLITKGKSGQKSSHLSIKENEENYTNYSENKKVCFSPILVYLFAGLALFTQLLLMFFCFWVLFNSIKRKKTYQNVLKSRSSNLNSDIYNFYSLRTGSTTLKNHLANTKNDNFSNDEEKWNKISFDKNLWPIKTSESNKKSNFTSMFKFNKQNNKHFLKKSIFSSSVSMSSSSDQSYY